MQNVERGWMALDNVTSHFSTMLEPIASASFLSSLSIIHAKTNRSLVTRVFPRYRPVTRVYFELSLAPSDYFLYSDWPLWLLWFWFSTLNWKALYSGFTNSLRYFDTVLLETIPIFFNLFLSLSDGYNILWHHLLTFDMSLSKCTLSKIDITKTTIDKKL